MKLHEQIISNFFVRVRNLSEKLLNMASKVTLSIFMVVLVFSAKAYKLQDTVVDDLMDQLSSVVNASVVTAQTALDDAQGALVKLASSTVETAETAMEATEKINMAALDELKAEAAEAGVNIDACLGDDETNLDNISTDFSVALRACVNATVAAGAAIEKKSLAAIEVLVGNITTIKGEITNCEAETVSTICMAKLKLEIMSAITSLPEAISANYIAAAAQITELLTDVTNCATDETALWTAKGSALLATITTCVDSLINV